VAVLAAACTSVIIAERPVIPLPAGLDRADARAAIVLELAKQPVPTPLPPGERVPEATLIAAVGARSVDGAKTTGWYPESLEGEVVNAAYKHGRNHYLRIAIFVEDRGVQTRIVQSQGMNQEGKSIHRSALVWQAELESRIQGALSRMAEVRRASAPGKAG
jgi:hypothetical protein